MCVCLPTLKTVKKHEVRITIFIAGVSCQDLSGGGVQGEGWIELSALNKMSPNVRTSLQRNQRYGQKKLLVCPKRRKVWRALTWSGVAYYVSTPRQL